MYWLCQKPGPAILASMARVRRSFCAPSRPAPEVEEAGRGQISPRGGPLDPKGGPKGAPGGGIGGGRGGGAASACLGRGMGDPEMQLIAVPGMSVAGTQDSLWLIHKGATVPPPSDPKNPPPSRPTTEKLTLALYKIDKQGTVIKLVDVRDISYDLGMVQFEDDQKPSVKEVAEKWKKANKP